MRPRLRRLVWWHLAGLAYGLGCRAMDAGEWAMSHVPGATPDEECRERMQARLSEAWAEKYGVAPVAPFKDEDVETDAATAVKGWVGAGVNARTSTAWRR